jgi:hypothetical protein
MNAYALSTPRLKNTCDFSQQQQPTSATCAPIGPTAVSSSQETLDMETRPPTVKRQLRRTGKT